MQYAVNSVKAGFKNVIMQKTYIERGCAWLWVTEKDMKIMVKTHKINLMMRLNCHHQV